MNTGDIPDTASASGLTEARKQLKLDKMSKEELNAYYRHLDNIVILRDNIFTERAEGRAEGIAEGLEKGRIEEKRNSARGMKALNIPIDKISEITGLSISEVEEL